MSLLAFLLFGLIVGLIARALMPGNNAMGLVMTTGLGIAGSFIGGLLVSLIAGYDVATFHPTGLIGSIIGSLLLLFLVSRFGRRGALA